MNDFVVSVNNSRFEINILNDSELMINDELVKYEIHQICIHSFILKLNNKIFQLTSEKINSDLFKVLVQGYLNEVTVRTALQERAYRLLESTVGIHHHHIEIKAPMPGLILKINKNVGDKVEMGNTVIILEAMKMENDIKSPASGTIKEIFVNEGKAVEKGVKLFSVA